MMVLQFPKNRRIVSELCGWQGQGNATPDSAFQANLTCQSHTQDLESEMSYPIMTAVLPLVLPANEKHVLTVLAFHADVDAECWPSAGLLAKECCLHHKEIRKCLAKLEKLGFLQRNFRRGRSTVYRIVPCANGVDHPAPMAHQNGKLNAGEARKLTPYEEYLCNHIYFKPLGPVSGRKARGL